MLVGPSLEIWEGHASDPEIRFRGSSGGVLTALALYCMEREGMGFALHTGMDPHHPWRNQTVRSRTREELFAQAGSRYSPSSPCDGLPGPDESGETFAFIGKPCDTAAVTMRRKREASLDGKLGLVMTFFCAGPPCAGATRELVKDLGGDPDRVQEIRYRGNGWPGHFAVRGEGAPNRDDLSYEESWGYLAKKHRSFRCHLCPDGLGELADVSSGDAWHRYQRDGNPGESVVIVRTERGKEMLHRAVKAGYLSLKHSDAATVVSGQGLVKRRAEVFGRIFAMRLLSVPTPQYAGFRLFRSWIRCTSPKTKAKTILGTLRRVFTRGLWHRNPPFPSPEPCGSLR